MPSNPSRIYWDSCVFLSYLDAIPERMPTLDALLYRAQTDSQLEIVTSTVSVVEVAFATDERGKDQLRAEELEKIEAFWADSSAFRLAEFHRLIATDARGLIRAAVAQGLSLKPMDAVHLATAQRLGVQDFHTYDERLFRFDRLFNFPIRHPFTEQLRLTS